MVAALSATTGENDPAFIQDLLAGAGDPDFGDHLSVAGLDATVTTAGGRTLTLGTDYTLGNGTLALTAAGFAKFDGLSAAQSDQAVFHFGVSDGIAAIPDTLTLSIIGDDTCEPDLGPVCDRRRAVCARAACQCLPGR